VTKRALLVAALAALLGACGGGADAQAPELPPALAASLAQRAEGVAEALDAGNPAVARRRADALLEQAIAAVNDGRVPPALAEPLLASVNALAASIPEAEPAQPAADERGKDEKEKKGKKDD
jgi:hypothetical protein